MKLRYFVLIFVAILGYNAFLIQRDQKLFDAYNRCLSVEHCSK